MKFRFVDRILSYKENDAIEGLKTVSLEEYLLLNPLGIRRGFPPTLMSEALFQLSNFLIYKTFKTKLAVLTMFRRIDIHEYLGPGHTMHMKVRLESVIDNSVKLSGAGYVAGREVIRGSGCIGMLVDIDTLYAPDAYEDLFTQLYRSASSEARD